MLLTRRQKRQAVNSKMRAFQIFAICWSVSTRVHQGHLLRAPCWNTQAGLTVYGAMKLTCPFVKHLNNLNLHKAYAAKTNFVQEKSHHTFSLTFNPRLALTSFWKEKDSALDSVICIDLNSSRVRGWMLLIKPGEHHALHAPWMLCDSMVPLWHVWG